MDVTDANPEFSWTFSDPDVGDTQGAYRLLVSSIQTNLDSNTGDVWDSGKVLSADLTAVYDGGSLRTYTTYYWKVCTWDDSDEAGDYCAVQTFHMTMKSPYQEYGNWYRVQDHCHTTNSDGADSPEAVVEWYRSNGYDMLVITDHNYITIMPPTTGIILIPGVEVTSGRHTNAINVSTVS